MMQKSGFRYANLSVDEHRQLFLRAGFTDIEFIEEYDEGWICAIGKSPSPVADNRQKENRRRSWPHDLLGGMRCRRTETSQDHVCRLDRLDTIRILVRICELTWRVRPDILRALRSEKLNRLA